MDPPTIPLPSGRIPSPGDVTFDIGADDSIRSPPHRPRSPSPSLTPSERILAAYMQLSPYSKEKVGSLLAKDFAALTHWSKSKLYLPFNLDEDAPIITPDTKSLPVSNLIDDLADSGFHVPLSLFTYDSLYKLQNQPLSVKTVKVHHRGQNVHILDISHFPVESDLSPLDWYLAWERLLDWIGCREGHIHKRMWSCHFHFLARKHKFAENFSAILAFDIEIRSGCALDSDSSISMDQYQARFFQLQMEHLRSSVPSEATSSSLDKQASHSQRPTPYDCKPRKDATDDSFRGNQCSTPICLICQRSGHKVNQCNKEVTQKGAQTFAKCRDGRLVRKDNNNPICFPFQLAAAKRPCRDNHPDQHVCATCGSHDHGTSNHKST